MVYIALEEANFLWRDYEVKRLEELWREGVDIMTMAKIFKRPQFEVAVLVMDRHIKGKIRKRKYGILSEEFLMRKVAK